MVALLPPEIWATVFKWIEYFGDRQIHMVPSVPQLLAVTSVNQSSRRACRLIHCILVYHHRQCDLRVMALFPAAKCVVCQLTRNAELEEVRALNQNVNEEDSVSDEDYETHCIACDQIASKLPFALCGLPRLKELKLVGLIGPRTTRQVHMEGLSLLQGLCHARSAGALRQLCYVHHDGLVCQYQDAKSGCMCVCDKLRQHLPDCNLLAYAINGNLTGGFDSERAGAYVCCGLCRGSEAATAAISVGEYDPDDTHAELRGAEGAAAAQLVDRHVNCDHGLLNAPARSYTHWVRFAEVAWIECAQVGRSWHHGDATFRTRWVTVAEAMGPLFGWLVELPAKARGACRPWHRKEAAASFPPPSDHPPTVFEVIFALHVGAAPLSVSRALVRSMLEHGAKVGPALQQAAASGRLKAYLLSPFDIFFSPRYTGGSLSAPQCQAAERAYAATAVYADELARWVLCPVPTFATLPVDRAGWPREWPKADPKMGYLS